MSVETSACPYCKSPDTDSHFVSCNDGKIQAGCMNCGACGPQCNTEEESAKSWNFIAARLAELEANEKEMSDWMHCNGIFYDMTFIDGLVRVINERDELKADKTDLLTACKKLLKAANKDGWVHIKNDPQCECWDCAKNAVQAAIAKGGEA